MTRWKTLSAITVIALLLWCSLAIAADQPQLKAEKYVLPNGLQVILHEDHSIPMVGVNVWYHVGSKNEKPGRTGFAHLFEHMMFQGSKNFDTEYFLPLEKIGADANGSTMEDRTNYWENVPSENLELALAMESDRMGHLLDVLTLEKLNNQRDVVKNERRQGVENAPYGVAEDMISALMYPPNHPYNWPVIGNMADLSAASVDDVKDFFRMYYSPNNASLCIAGDFDPVAIKQLVDKYFGSIPPGPPVSRLKGWIPEMTGIRRALSEDRVELPRVYMMWHSPAYYTPGDAEADLLADILANGMNARLNASLTYKQQIAQELYAYQGSRELGSLFNLVVTAKPGHSCEELEAAIDAELKTLIRDGITPRELLRAQTNREVSFVRRLQNVGGFGGRADILNEYNTYLGTPDKLAWDMDRYKKATVESVNQFIRTYLDLNRRGILYVVPQGNMVAGTEPDRSKAPQTGAPKDFVAPDIETATLSNGLKVLLVEDHRLPLVNLQLVIKRGWTADPTGKFGTGSLTADLLDEGIKKLSALQIADTVRALGAYLSSGSNYDATFISLDVLKRNFAPALGLAADMLLTPTFAQPEIDRLKKDRLGQIESGKAEPRTAAGRAFRTQLYGASSPYGQYPDGTGTEESLKNITRDDIVAFAAANYLPNLSAVVMSGDITLADATALLEKAFATWKQGTAKDVPLPTPSTRTSPTVYIVDKPGAQQSVILAGYGSIGPSDPDFLPFMLLNQQLGGQFTSRINLNLREDKGYTYGSYSNVDAGPFGSTFYVAAPVHSQFTKEALSEILKELKDVGTTRPLSDDELTNAKLSTIKTFPQGFQSLYDITSQLRNVVMFDRPMDYWKTLNQRVTAVDQARIKDVTAKTIHPDQLLIVIVGDKAKIEAGINELGLGAAQNL